MEEDAVAGFDVAELAVVLLHLDLRAHEALLHLGHGAQIGAERHAVGRAAEGDDAVADGQVAVAGRRHD